MVKSKLVAWDLLLMLLLLDVSGLGLHTYHLPQYHLTCTKVWQTYESHHHRNTYMSYVIIQYCWRYIIILICLCTLTLFLPKVHRYIFIPVSFFVLYWCLRTVSTAVAQRSRQVCFHIWSSEVGVLSGPISRPHWITRKVDRYVFMSVYTLQMMDSWKNNSNSCYHEK